MQKKHAVVLSLLALTGLACSGDAPDGETADVVAGPSIAIARAEAGEAAGSITIELSATGVEIVPAGIEQANSGHHHLFINRDPTPVGETIPAEEGIVHLGAAQTEYEFTGLEPGEYVITAVLGDHLHVRLAEVEVVSTTVTVN